MASGGCGNSVRVSSCCESSDDAVDSFSGSGGLTTVLDKDKLLEEELPVWSVALVERRRLNKVWKDAIDDRRRSDVRRESDDSVTSLDPLFREGILPFAHVIGMKDSERQQRGLFIEAGPASSPIKEGTPRREDCAFPQHRTLLHLPSFAGLDTNL